MINKKNVFTGLIVSFLGVFTLVLHLPVSYSQDEAVCPDFTVQQIQNTKQEFYTNLQKLVSDATPASTNTTLTFDLYRKYLSDLSNLFQDNAENVSEQNQLPTAPQTTVCQKIISNDKEAVQETIQSVLKASISGKQSFNLIEKYSHINQKFTDLNQQSNQVSKKIKDFSQQLPCYSHACVQD